MSELTVASRYAKSLIELAQENKVLEDIKNDMEFFMRVLKENSQLQAVLGNPIISHTKKLGVLLGVFEAKINKISTAFFKLMVNKGRGEILYATAHEFVEQYNVIKHITKASVVSATPLSEENKKLIEEDVKKAIGGTVVLETKVDPALIGGFVLTIGDRQLDTSIASSLKKLKKDFAGGVIQ